MGTVSKAKTLASAIKRECMSHSGEEIGVVLTTLLVDFARFVGMPKTQFMEMINEAWDMRNDDTTDEAEVH